MHKKDTPVADSHKLLADAQRAILGSIFASITDSLLIMDAELRVVEANEHLLTQIGRTRDETMGQEWVKLFPHLSATGRLEELREVLANGQPQRSRVPVLSGEGDSLLFDVSTYPVHDPATGAVTHVVEFAREITEEVRMQLQVMDAHTDLLRAKELLEENKAQLDTANNLLEEKCQSLETANRRLERLAVIDVMTDLPNHRAFQEQLSYQIKQAQRHHRPFSLLLFDVDNFKLYNDRFGHPEGDKLLAAISLLVRSSIRTIDLPSRYGGEEFVIILPETDRYGAIVVAERLRAAVAEHQFQHSSVTISIGIAEFPSDSEDGGGLVQCADKAMYHAKSCGKNSVSLWRGPADGTPIMNDKSQQSLYAMTRRCLPVPGLPGHLEKGSASGNRLLLVDQDELSLGTLREALQVRGYAVSCAGSAQEALDILSSAAGGIDLLLTDVALPDKDGIELRTEARVLCPGMPVVFTSAYANPALLRQVLADESCEFLAKPFHGEDLVRLIDAFLTRRVQLPETSCEQEELAAAA